MRLRLINDIVRRPHQAQYVTLERRRRADGTSSDRVDEWGDLLGHAGRL